MPLDSLDHARNQQSRPRSGSTRIPIVLLFLAAIGAVASGTALGAPASFAPKVDCGTGGTPAWVALADLNGDGHLDLATANYASNSVSVLLGNGAGGFGTKTDFATGTGPMAVMCGDLSGDGYLDLASANLSANTASVLLGNGLGGFGARTDFATGSAPYAAALGDVNGDGRPDLVVAYTPGSSVSVLLGNGAGGFGPKTDFTTGLNPGAVAIGDVNRDGKPDVLAANTGASTISVLLGNGLGGFGAKTDFTTGNSPQSLAVADLNGDGNPDMAAGNCVGNTVSVLLGTGTGSFGAKTDFATGAWPRAVGIGDLNGDGKPDLAVGNYNSSTISVLLGTGTGSFGTKTDFATGSKPISLVVADLNWDGKRDLAVANSVSNTVSVLINTSLGANTVAPQPPTACITPTHACVQVPVTITRTTSDDLRSFSVTLQLSGGLALCDGGIVEGTYLKGIGGTAFQVVDNGGGSYSVDCAILGLPCGATAASGTLFVLNLGSGISTGTGTVTVTAVTLRDCGNDPMTASAGAPAGIAIDNSVPAALALSAAQRTSGNDGDGTTKIILSWTGAVIAGDSVLVYRAGFGSYPEYDLGGAVPATPSYPPGAPWVLVGRVVGASSFADETASRDYWYYVAFVKDPCGNVGSVSNQTTGTLNYFLGDVHNGGTDCQGNNLVAIEDISFLGSHYGAALADPDPLGCLDVGPTADRRVSSRPLPDDRVNFEDLMLFAINYDQVSAPPLAPEGVAGGGDVLTLEAPAAVAAGDVFAVTLRLQGSGDVQGLSSQLAWDRSVAEPVATEAGALLTAQGGVAFSARPGNVDCAVLGPGRTLSGGGGLAVVTFRALRGGEPRVELAAVQARDVGNQPVALGGTQPGVPTETWLAPATPNPTSGATTLSYALALGGDVALAVYGVDGRRVVTLASGVQEAGTHRRVWDGRDASGRPLKPGLYYVRLTTVHGRFTRVVVLVR